MHLQNDPIFTEADLSGGRGGGVSKGQRFEEGSRGVATVSQICLACGARPEMDHQASPSTGKHGNAQRIPSTGTVGEGLRLENLRQFISQPEGPRILKR